MRTAIRKARCELWRQRRELYRSAIRPEGKSQQHLSFADMRYSGLTERQQDDTAVLVVQLKLFNTYDN